MEYQNLTFNLGGRVRHEMLEGRQCLVVPTAMIVEGVLNGSNGPLLYPADELAFGPGIWDHRPLVLGHPDGTACDPVVLNSRKIGVILNTRWKSPKLHTEAWIDVERCSRLDRRILDRLQNGEKVEVSTGLHVNIERRMGEFRGRRYDGIARNYRPDHLAVLPDTVGACSIADGAGMLQNALSPAQAAMADWFERQLKLTQGPPILLPHAQREFEQQYNMAGGPQSPAMATLAVSNQAEWDDEVYAPPTLNFPNPLLPESEQHVPDDEPAPTANNEPPPVLNPAQPPLHQWLQVAPPAVQNLVHDALRTEATQKARLIAEITANRANQFTADWLATQSVQFLEGLANFARCSPPAPPPIVNYFGQQGYAPVPAIYAPGDDWDDGEIYTPPTMNFDNPLEPKRAQQHRASSRSYEDDGDEYYPAPVLTFDNPLVKRD